MRIFAFLAGYRRLSFIIGLSLCAHLLAIALIDPAPTRATLAGKEVLTVRLALTAPATPAPVAQPPASASPPGQAQAQAAPQRAAQASRARRTPAAVDAPPQSASTDSADTPLVTAMDAPAIVVDGPPPAAPTAPAPGDDGSAHVSSAPSHFRIAPGPSAVLAYTVRRSRSDGAMIGSDTTAAMDWVNQGIRYQLRMNGLLGELESEGAIDDSGLAPHSLVEPLGGGAVTTRFDREHRVIVAGRDNTTHRLLQGSQDTLSVLAQLSGIGLADPDQMQGELAFWTGGADGARTVRFEVLGKEQLRTGAGDFDTVRLARLPDPQGGDSRRLEVWLATGSSWLPVQLRLTGADGVAVTQTVTAIEIAPVPAF